MLQKGYISIVFLATLMSCNFFAPSITEKPIARVNDSYLYEDDIKGLISENTTKSDSATIVTNYINRWATQQLLIDKANINLPEAQILAYERMVEDYRNDLFSEAYKGVIVGKQLDSTITNEEFNSYYESHKQNFTLKDEVYTMRYIYVDKSFDDISETKQKLSRFNKEDKMWLTNKNLQFVKANFNDSTWIKKEVILKQLPIVRGKEDRVLKKAAFTQLEDSLGVYLLKIEAVLSPPDIAPLQYIKPTIEEIILSKRTLQLIKNLEKDITKDAIKNKNFEIFNTQ